MAKRLRAMSWRELLYRAGRTMQARAEKLGWGIAAVPVPTHKDSSAWCKTFPVVFNTKVYQAAADRILNGHFDVFAMREVPLGFPPNWNQDPKTKTAVPLLFGKTLNYRNERVVGDIKYLWETNRHLELVTLAQTWQLTGELRYAQACQTLLNSWFEQCPYPLGVNWVSALEHSLRLLNWSFAWHLLGDHQSPLFAGRDGAAFKARWLESIYQHCHFIAGHFSFHSSANNHLLGEYMGLLIGTLTWPLWPASATWQTTAEQGFLREALEQTYEDGVNKEQAFYYHLGVIDMMVLCGLISRANHLEFAPIYWQRLEKMLDFLAAVMDRAGHVPMVGDADDSLMVRLNQEANWSPYRSMLATGAVLFERGDFAAKAGSFDDKSRWLLGDQAAAKFAALTPSSVKPPQTLFPKGGYYLLGARFDEVDEVRAMVDCGPLGYLSIAAHGHADALAMVLSAGGHELLVDPGTYAYHTQKKWRNYFRGTFAHNSICVDHVNQSEIGGSFLWLHKARAHCDVAEILGDIQRFSGWHDGYHSLADPVTHRRDIEFSATSNCFEITDFLSCNDQHHIEVCWHIAEHCSVALVDKQAIIRNGHVCLALSLENSSLSPALIQGQEDPPAGWISRSFDVKVPTNTLVWRGSIHGDTRLSTHLQLSFDGTLR